jgi:hypothetical protein
MSDETKLPVCKLCGAAPKVLKSEVWHSIFGNKCPMMGSCVMTADEWRKLMAVAEPVGVRGKRATARPATSKQRTWGSFGIPVRHTHISAETLAARRAAIREAIELAKDIEAGCKSVHSWGENW